MSTQADLRRLIRWALEMLDQSVELHETSNGAGALAMASLLKPRVMVLDVMMPGGLDGLEVARQVRKTPELEGTKIVMLSAKGQQTDVQAGLEAGADIYMVKPFSPKRLLDAVEPFLTATA